MSESEEPTGKPPSPQVGSALSGLVSVAAITIIDPKLNHAGSPEVVIAAVDTVITALTYRLQSIIGQAINLGMERIKELRLQVIASRRQGELARLIIVLPRDNDFGIQVRAEFRRISTRWETGNISSEAFIEHCDIIANRIGENTQW